MQMATFLQMKCDFNKIEVNIILSATELAFDLFM